MPFFIPSLLYTTMGKKRPRQVESKSSNLQPSLTQDTNSAKEISTQKAREDLFNTKVEEFNKSCAEMEAEKTMIAKSCAEMEAERSDWEDEKTMIANTQKFDTLVDLNVGGTRYTARLETLTKYPDSMLGAMFSGRHTLKKTEQGEYFIDRSGRLFTYILQFLRDPEYKCFLSGERLKELKREALYFGLNDAMFPLPPVAAIRKDNSPHFNFEFTP